MSAAVITYEAPSGLWSACLLGVAILAHAVSKGACAAAIASAVEGIDVEEIMASPVSPDEWRAALTASTVGALSDLRADLEHLSDGALAQALVTKTEHVEGIVRELHQQQGELLTLEKAKHAQRAKLLEINAQQERRIEAQRKQKQDADNAARWVDVQVSQLPDGSVEMLKHFVEFVAFVGPNREPEFRKYAVKLGSWKDMELVPPDVRARINKPFVRSRPWVPER